ncbi:MAG TPA: FKBP-type peptidyl-prolyl cis-trans isomerase [Pseudomonadota bacterium]|nr:FKBP-type peptidyl-prolyl cis-trans isomerase [Pseudomonadota bacterium]
MDAKMTQLQKTDTTVGTGAEAVAGKIIVVHYTGWLYDPAAPDKKGRKFDSSLDRHSPFSFPLGGHQVIRGWDEGVVGMRVGGKRELVIPSEMAYGSRGAGGGLIPPNATLVFDIELLDVKDN